ncbi:ABC transporter permease [Methanofollis sp. UBA420]|jgi:lipopolysaccharide transport system permease protein|uniref:ABC transporter permease n=1 Tax=Methanofollis sp. UBA420 TaxID=1915514 RepID=UPI00316AD7A8
MSLSGQLPLLIELARRDLWERYSGSSLGALWSVIFPLVTVFIYLIVFANIMGARLPGSSNAYSYGIYLLAGVIPWTTFSSVVMRSSTVYLDRKNIISKIHVDLNCFPLYIVISESIIFGITLAIILVFLFATGYEFPPVLFALPVVFAAQQFVAYALGSILGILVVFLRDMRETVNVVFQLWFWLTPIVYVTEILPEFVKGIEVFNPAFWFVNSYQSMFSYGQLPNGLFLILLFGLGIVLLAVKQYLMRRLERDIRDFI